MWPFRRKDAQQKQTSNYEGKGQYASSISEISTERQEISTLLSKTMEKAKQCCGDPFSEYRKLDVLPPRFEHGMNCALDRMTEQHGITFAQMVYEEVIKDAGNYTIQRQASGYDPLPGGLSGVKILILFTVNARAFIESQNTVARLVKMGGSIPPAREPIFF